MKISSCYQHPDFQRQLYLQNSQITDLHNKKQGQNTLENPTFSLSHDHLIWIKL